MIEFTAEEREELLALIFQKVLERYTEPMGKSIAAFWYVARGVGRQKHVFASSRFFNLKFKKNWITMSEAPDGEVMCEKATWTVWAYNYDYTKDDPFATEEESKTLVVENLLVSGDDIEYPQLRRQMEEEEEGLYQ